MSRDRTVPDLPELPSGATLDQVIAWLQQLRTRSVAREPSAVGDPQQKFVTRADLVNLNVLALSKGGAYTVGTLAGGGSGVIGGDGGSTDLTAPASIANLTVTAGLTNFFVEFDAPAYPQGGGNAYTEIYAANWAGAPAALPTFADAVQVYQVTGAATIAIIGAQTGQETHFWAGTVSVAGVRQVDGAGPTGGINGVSATTGKIGNADLGPLIIEAQNLANGAVDVAALADEAVTAQKLGDGAVTASKLIVTDLTNVILDPKGVSVDAWQGSVAATPGATFWPAAMASNTAISFEGRDSFYGTPFACSPSDQFYCEMDTVPFGGGASTYAFSLGLRFTDKTGAVISYSAAATRSVGTSGFVLVAGSVAVPTNAAFAMVWMQIDGPAGTPFTANGQGHYATNMVVRRKNAGSLIVDGAITADHLAANSIAVGTAAIQDGAIVNAMIGDATIDDAKVANLSAGKLTAGSIAVGEYLQSTSYVPGSAGWRISGNGVAEFSGVIVRGTIIAGGGSIGGASIDNTGVQSVSYVAGSSGWRLDNASGAILAYTGTIGGAVLDATGIQSSNYVPNSTGWRLDNASGSLFANSGYFSGTLKVGTASKVYVSSTLASLVTSPGVITSISSGTVTGLVCSTDGGNMLLICNLNVYLNINSNTALDTILNLYCDGVSLFNSSTNPQPIIVGQLSNVKIGGSTYNWTKSDNFDLTILIPAASLSAGTHTFSYSVLCNFLSSTGTGNSISGGSLSCGGQMKVVDFIA